MGIDLTTNKPKSNLISRNTGILTHMAQWRGLASKKLDWSDRRSKKRLPKPNFSSMYVISNNNVEPLLSILSENSNSIIVGSRAMSSNELNPKPASSLASINGGIEEGDELMLENDRSYNQVPGLNERFDDSMLLHYTTYHWSRTAATGDIV
ncbi:hypothetical protein Golax_005972 [Gossypium laxum]|uniref:Uncharacterized protein n=1 Tax=Gossypium laxum TaxID=34288 RepID=A0A7J9A2J6_9ROSI|nr:hypothetical protein [Gossypium laxum]